MIDWFTDPLSFPFMQRALIGAILAVATTAVVGTWVVLRGMSFMGDALAHGVLPGIALAFLVGFDVTLGAMLGAVVMVAGVNLVHRRSGLSEDTGIGLLFVGMLALGVMIISRSRSFAVSLTGFLFGDVLGITRGDLVLQAGAAVVALLGSMAFYRAFLVLSFNEQKAEVLGLHPRAAHFAMLALVGLSIVTSFRAVGTLLVFGLLVAPPATAALLVRRVPAMMMASVGLGVLAVVVGLLVSFHADTAASATIAGLSVALFFIALAGRETLRLVRRRSAAMAPP